VGRVNRTIEGEDEGNEKRKRETPRVI